jgi:hypothetical protein
MRRTGLRLVLLCVALAGMLLLPNPAAAASITIFENAKLTTGSLAGTAFPFSFSYESTAVSGVGQEFISLTGFNFNLLGSPYALADITQGGQAIFQNGVLQNVTAAFLTIPPATRPVFSIAFGFGGPGVIGYIDLDRNFGEGTYTQASVAEPSSLFSVGLGIALIIRKRRRSPHFINSISF